jgi:hypothetical protein
MDCDEDYKYIFSRFRRKKLKITISQHALQQMFKRDIPFELVKAALLHGETIRIYDNDKPYPSKISFFAINDGPIHVVFAENVVDQELIVITAYEPDLKIWHSDFKTKK